MSFGDGDLHVKCEQLEQRVAELEAERQIWVDGWMCDRMTKLEQLVRDMDACRREPKCCNCAKYGRDEDGDETCCAKLGERMAELGIEEW